MCHTRLRAFECGDFGSYPRFPSRAFIFMHLTLR